MGKMDLKEILESLHKSNFPVHIMDPAPIVVPEDMINYNPECILSLIKEESCF